MNDRTITLLGKESAPAAPAKPESDYLCLLRGSVAMVFVMAIQSAPAQWRPAVEPEPLIIDAKIIIKVKKTCTERGGFISRKVDRHDQAISVSCIFPKPLTNSSPLSTMASR